jgi:hypothetical protein
MECRAYTATTAGLSWFGVEAVGRVAVSDIGELLQWVAVWLCRLLRLGDFLPVC